MGRERRRLRLGRVRHDGPHAGPVEDSFNITRHAIELTGLLPGTTCQFRVSKKHAIDRTSLAGATGQFTTRRRPVDINLTQRRPTRA